MHVYGAGDPCELPFLAACGATIFDSASYGHYAQGGWYMTPYGALTDPGPVLAGEFACSCPACLELPVAQVLADEARLCRHNLWTICDTVRGLRGLVGDRARLHARLEEILRVHAAWFPRSRLVPSWRSVQDTVVLP
jgi:7-cyano-7-deazaguanine tRNA-ribosyltransferase